jgi:oxalate decarboxylase/phosphoglucose isomerase-like protein (cupin superfamily)
MGDAGYVHQTLARYIENTGTEDLRFPGDVQS